MKKSAVGLPKLQKEDVKQAVVVDYKAIGCKSPEQGNNKKPFIQYTLEWLLIEKFDDVFICCLPDNAQELRELVKDFIKVENLPASMRIQIHSSEDNHSTGDCLRDLDSKALIKSDFVIMDVGCCGNLPLAELLENHKKLKKVDKSAIMTSIVRNIFTKDPEVIGEFPIYVIEPKSGQLLFFAAGRVSLDQPKQVVQKSHIELPTRLFLDHESVKIHNNLCSTNLSIYSSNLPALFAEFFDCHTEASLIQAALDHHDTLGYAVYIHTVDDLFSQHIADMGFVINQKRDHFDTSLIYQRSERYDTLRQLVNKSLIDCTRLNTLDYLSTLTKEESEESENESESDDSLVDENEAFFSQVLESLIRGYEENISHENLILEVNASKHAYNISIEDIHSTIARVILMLPLRLTKRVTSTTEYERCVEKIIKTFEDFMLNYFKSAESKVTLLATLEDLFISSEIEFLTDLSLAKVFFFLYHADVLDESSLMSWHARLPDDDEDDRDERVNLRNRPPIKKLIESLSDDEESD